jgi:cathepsin B
MLRVIVLVAAVACAHAALNLNAPATDHSIIRQINSNPKSTWTAGVNKRFAKATVGEAKQLLGVRRNGFKLARKQMKGTYDASALPDNFDARTQWGKMCPSVSEVRDQSACGSCWAFGAVEAMTDRTCIQSGGKNMAHLSAEDMNSCCTFCGAGCDGGDPGSAWFYWTVEGVVDGGNYGQGGCAPYSLAPCEHHINGTHYPHCPSDEYPTPACPTTCGNNETFSSAKHFGSSSYSIDSNPNDIMQEIMTNGPVEVAFTVYSDFLTYKSGVYQYTSGDELGGHAVKMLGWGSLSGTPYWIIANSWNADWGNGGYFLILRGQDECGIEDDVCAGMYKN